MTSRENFLLMNFLKALTNIFLILIFLMTKAQAAFDVRGVQLFRDNNVCITPAGSTSSQGFSLGNILTNSESIQSKASSSGSFCPIPPFFTGGAILTTSGTTIQAQPTVQGLGRGILISEVAGNSSGVSSSGDPAGFTTLISNLGGVANSIFEIRLPNSCDVIDDDNDIEGASTDLTTINDFSFPTCTSTNSLTVQCNAASNLLTTANGLVPASSSEPAKIRFAISATNAAVDTNMIDSILIRLDSQDIFCPDTISGPLTATIIAKNKVDNPTISETLGTADLGTPTKAVKISYAQETATSVKGETSTNEIDTTAVLTGNSTSILNIIEIEELHNESIPASEQSSATLINPSVTSTAENNVINLWIIPSLTSLFSNAPASSDITFSDNSLIVHSAPYIVKTNTDDLNAPYGTLVIPIRRNPGTVDPGTLKTKITTKNIVLNTTGISSNSSTISLALFESISGAIVNTPGGLSINNSTNPTNPQNFSAFSPDSTRALAQNAVVGGAVNESTAAKQVQTDGDLLALTNRNTTLGTPQANGFIKIISSLTTPDVNKITFLNDNSVLTIIGNEGASIGGAKIKIKSFAKGETSTFDSVTVTSKSNGSFKAKLQVDLTKGDASLEFSHLVSGSESQTATKAIPKESSSTSSEELPCEQTVCGCDIPNCTPAISLVLSYIQNNGGLANVVSSGGNVLQEVINSAKKALGLT